MDPQLEPLHRELSDEIHADLGPRIAARPMQGMAAAAPMAAVPGSMALVESLVRNGLNFAAQTLGDGATTFILANKDLVREWIGEPVLECADRLIHGLEDAKQQAGGS